MPRFMFADLFGVRVSPSLMTRETLTSRRRAPLTVESKVTKATEASTPNRRQVRRIVHPDTGK